MIFTIIGWAIFGFLVGLVAKFLTPGKDPSGFFATIGIGIAGAYIGGFINYLLGWGGDPLTPAGFFMGVAGGVVFCLLLRVGKKHLLNKDEPKEL